MSKSNLDWFNEISSAVFVELYAAFPVPKTIDCLAVTGCKDVDDFGRGCPESDICAHTLIWLQENGYVRFSEPLPYGAKDVVLSAQGLQVLMLTPESLESKKTLGEQMTHFLKAGAAESAREVLKVVLARGAGMIGVS